MSASKPFPPHSGQSSSITSPSTIALDLTNKGVKLGINSSSDIFTCMLLLQNGTPKISLQRLVLDHPPKVYSARASNLDNIAEFEVIEFTYWVRNAE